MGKYFIFDEAAGLVIPEVRHSLYSARDKAETMIGAATPGGLPRLLVCEAHCRVHRKVEVSTETDNYPDPLFGPEAPEVMSAPAPVSVDDASEEPV